MPSFIDLTGCVFGRLTVLSKDSLHASNGGTKWICQCSCGALASIRSDGLRSGHSKSCGCLNRELSYNRPSFDLSNKCFGRLTVLKRDHERTDAAYWICQCSCGNIKSILASSLRKGNTTSCGCFKKEINISQITTLNRSIKLANGLDPDSSVQLEYEQHRSKFKKIRHEILLRDNNKCILCSVSNKLQVHHIVPLSQNLTINLASSNLVTLCKKCHFVHAHNKNTQTIDLTYQNIFKSYLTNYNILISL